MTTPLNEIAVAVPRPLACPLIPYELLAGVGSRMLAVAFDGTQAGSVTHPDLHPHPPLHLSIGLTLISPLYQRPKEHPL